MKPSDLEETLTAAYQHEAACYRQALQAAGGIDDALRQSRTASLEKLLGSLDKVAVTEAGIQDAKKQWQRLAHPASPGLQAARDEVAILIEALRGLIGSAELQARAALDRLQPQLDQVVRGRQMQSAYRGTMATRHP